MPTQIEMLKQEIADLEARVGPDGQFVKPLKQQLAGMELNQRNQEQRFLAGSLPSASTQAEIETEEDSIRAEAIRRERVRRMMQDASRRFPATPTDTSSAPLGWTRDSLK